MHSAKGLEFPIVFIMGMEDFSPHIRAIKSEVGREMQEERRICYVAITRAKEVCVSLMRHQECYLVALSRIYHLQF